MRFRSSIVPSMRFIPARLAHGDINLGGLELIVKSLSVVSRSSAIVLVLEKCGGRIETILRQGSHHLHIVSKRRIKSGDVDLSEDFQCFFVSLFGEEPACLA